MNQVDKTIQRSVNYSVSYDKMSVVHLDGRECIEKFTDCLGDNIGTPHTEHPCPSPILIAHNTPHLLRYVQFWVCYVINT